MLRWRVPSKSRDQDSAAPFFPVHNLIDVEEAGVESGFGVIDDSCSVLYVCVWIGDNVIENGDYCVCGG